MQPATSQLEALGVQPGRDSSRRETLGAEGPNTSEQSRFGGLRDRPFLQLISFGAARFETERPGSAVQDFSRRCSPPSREMLRRSPVCPRPAGALERRDGRPLRGASPVGQEGSQGLAFVAPQLGASAGGQRSRESGGLARQSTPGRPVGREDRFLRRGRSRSQRARRCRRLALRRSSLQGASDQNLHTAWASGTHRKCGRG